MMVAKFHHFLLFTALLLFGIACKKSPANHSEIAQEVTDTLSKRYPVPQTDSVSIRLFLANHPGLQEQESNMLAYYSGRQFSYAWFHEIGLNEQSGFFINLLHNLGDEGISDTLQYLQRTEFIYNLISSPGYPYRGADSLTHELEMLLSAQFFLYADRVWNGLHEEKTKSLEWHIQRKNIPYTSMLDSLLLRGPQAFNEGHPVYRQYYLLRDALKAWRPLATADWPALSLPEDVSSYSLGDSADVIAAMQERLRILGDLDSGYRQGMVDSLTYWGIIHFQSRHGLSSDGKAGKQFFRQLNVSPAERMRQIEVNMERCRWVPIEQAGNRIMVNIPEFMLYVYEADSIAFSMPIIVGTASNSTIIFNDELEYIVFSPYWVVPPSIIQEEIVPAVVKNSRYLSQHHMEVYSHSTNQVIASESIAWSNYVGKKFPYGIRQLPGAHNSLGWVKFVFPNQYYIYMHDTPSRNLFANTQRSYSHGCIRLSDPVKLANYLLSSDSSWTGSKIDSVMHGGVETYVALDQKMPVFIAYFTAWVDAQGVLQFRDDLYNHDEPLKELLSGDTPTLSRK
jgi:murein L,D-transpeptidase YcbB/YkuD